LIFFEIEARGSCASCSLAFNVSSGLLRRHSAVFRIPPHSARLRYLLLLGRDLIFFVGRVPQSQMFQVYH